MQNKNNIYREIIDEFSEKEKSYNSLGDSMNALINALIVNEGVSIHSMNHRVKDKKSLERKIKEKNKYNNINDITDVLGLRVITYYSKDVDLIEDMIKREFLVDEDNTVDKRKKESPDRFGYMSLHYIVSLNKVRSSLVEYMNFKNIRFEIQIRTILQHTWAEIEHDLGYKSNTSVPEHIRRKFSILSGCLELIDSQFVEISESLKTYDAETKNGVSLKEGGEHIGIDAISLKNYVLGSNDIQLLHDKLIDMTEIESGVPREEFTKLFVNNKKDDEHADYSGVAAYLNKVGVSTLKQLDAILADFHDDDKLIKAILETGKIHWGDEHSGAREIKIYIKYFLFLYLVYAYIFKSGKSESIAEYEGAYRVMNKFKDTYENC